MKIILLFLEFKYRLF